MYLSTKQIAEKWNISDRRVRLLCSEGKVDGAFKDGRNWKVPENAKKPTDNRFKEVLISEEFKEIFARIESKKAELKKMRPLTKGEIERLQEEFAIEYTYNSNAIEGNTLTLSETEAVLKDNVTIGGKPLKDHLEVIGHKQAFDYMVQIASEKKSFSERTIKEIHSLVLADKPQDKGIYRRIPVRILGSKHTPPEPLLIEEMMGQLIKEYRDTKGIYTVEKVALFHLKFESIHPFVDGNGRCGRLLLNFDLIKNGYPNIDIKFTDRQEYYDCFNEYHETGSHTKLTMLVARYVEEMLDKYLYILR